MVGVVPVGYFDEVEFGEFLGSRRQGFVIIGVHPGFSFGQMPDFGGVHIKLIACFKESDHNQVGCSIFLISMTDSNMQCQSGFFNSKELTS